MSYVIGIDSGVRHIGIAVLDSDSHQLLYCEEQAVSSYIAYHLEFTKLLQQWKPSLIVIEKPFFTAKTIGKNTRTLETIGIQKLCCEQQAIQCEVLSPKAAKKIITGNGNAKKAEVIQAVKVLFELNAQSTHVADAIAIAYSALQLNLCPTL